MKEDIFEKSLFSVILAIIVNTFFSKHYVKEQSRIKLSGTIQMEL